MFHGDGSTLSPISFFTKLNNLFKKSKIQLSYWFINKMEISKQELEPVPTFLNKIGDFFLKPFINKDLITQILMGEFSFQTFRVGYEVGLFHYLNSNPGATLNEISQQLKIATYPTEVLLLGLAGLKVIKKVGESYYNSAVTRIVTSNPTNKFTHFFPKYMKYAHNVLSDGIHYLHESIIENKPVGLHKMFGSQATDYYYELSKDERTNQHFVQHMSAFSQINADRVASMPIFNKTKKLLDVGGSVGDVALSIAKQNPNIHVTVYDHPAVADMATKKFQEANLSQRLDAIGGDLMSNPFPKNYDGVLFAHFIDIFSQEANADFFQRAFDCLTSKGHIIVYTPVVNDNEGGPLVNCLLGIYFLCLANGKGRFYSAAQIKNWMKTIGFININIHRLPANEVIIVGMKP